MNEQERARVAEIEARRAAILPGEWWCDYAGSTRKWHVYERPNERHPHTNKTIVTTGYEDLNSYAVPHAEFIANAPDDIDALLALVKKLSGGSAAQQQGD